MIHALCRIPTPNLLGAPAPPDAGRVAAVTALPTNRALRNAAAFDRLWERMARTYFSGANATPQRTQWDAVRTAAVR